MDIPTNLLEVLKCDYCRDYLSHSPVYLKHNGFTLCGRCFVAGEEESESANRLKQYEAAASLLKFPCKYKIYGCEETVPFAEDAQEKPHEQGCEFRNYNCPIIETNDCAWVGLRKYLVSHCQASHPGHVANNPCHLRYDIAHFSAKTYIIQSFDVIFLLHTKVCVATGKIYHSVRLLDNPDKISQFKYTLDIKREELVISRPGKVAPQNCVGIEENAIVTNVSSMLDFLNGFSGTIFTVKIINVGNKPNTNVVQPVRVNKLEQVLQEIMKAKPSTSTVVPSGFRNCRNRYRGCTFSDTEIKCEKHEEFFCPYRTFCWGCWSPVSITDVKTAVLTAKSADDAWQAHNLAAHDNYLFQGGVNFDVTTTGVDGRTVYVKTHIGVVHCRYILLKDDFKLYVWSPALSKHLSRYRCVLKLTDPVFSQTISVTPDVQLNDTWDWIINLDKVKKPNWNNKFDVSLQISRK